MMLSAFRISCLFRYRVFFLYLLALAPCLANASGLETTFFVEKLDEGVFVHRGAHAGLEDPARGDSANIGFIIGETCVAVVDTGGSINTGRNLLRAVREKTSLPICYVINTHVHFDHVLGNAAFVAEDPIFVGHENLAAAMVGNKTFFVEQFATELAGGGEDLIIEPSLLVKTEQTIDLGERQLVLRPSKPAHTDADLTVYDAKSNLLWAGDLVFRERMPILDASLRGWLTWLDSDYASMRVVPGHGKAGESWAKTTKQIRDYLQALLTESRKAIADGLFLEDALDSVAKQASMSWQLNDRHARNVSKAYRELEWE
jgi:quinoprotein relay system zinc metallohydrolase 2